MNPTDPTQDPNHEDYETSNEEPTREYTERSLRKKPLDKAMILSWGISIACCSVFLLIAALIVIDVMQEEEASEIAYEHTQEFKQEPPKPIPIPTHPKDPTNNPTFNDPPELPPPPVYPGGPLPPVPVPGGGTDTGPIEPKYEPGPTGGIPPIDPKTFHFPTTKMPKIVGSRCDEADRMDRLEKFGGKPATEDAVVKALDWLKTVQNQDGSWGDKYKGAMTGLALLSYLGHCEKQDSPKYGVTVKRGILYLLELNEKQNGKMYTSKPAYETGIAAYALGEAYIITKNFYPKIKGMDEALQKSISVIIQGQKADGGWDYGYSTGMTKPSDTSVSGWQIQALKVAKLTGLEFESINMTLDKAMENILRVRGPKGGFGYRDPQDKLSLSGVGVLALQMWEPKKYRSEITEGVNFIVNTYNGYNDPSDHFNKYGWYYHTQAAYQHGGSQWRDWNNIFQDTLLKKQSPEGYWMDWGHQGHGPDANTIEGKIYTTTLCTLMLEIYYRYLQNTGDDKFAKGATGLKET